MSEYKSKIWLGVGVCTFLGAADLAEAKPSFEIISPPAVEIATGDGGEGGEGGGAEVSDQDAATYMLGLYQMEGIMRAGHDLYQLGDMDGALAQFNALLDVFNGEIGKNLEKLGFERDHVLVEAEQLPQAIEYKETKEEFLHTYDHLLKELDEHALNVEAIERRDPEFVLDLTVALLQKVAAGYASKDVAKQTSAAGLALTVRDLIGWTASELRRKDKQAFNKVVNAIDEITDLLPVKGPFTADVSKIFGLAATAEFAMVKLR